MASQTAGSFLAAGQALARQGNYEAALSQFNKVRLSYKYILSLLTILRLSMPERRKTFDS
jgi:hypothetical protein